MKTLTKILVALLLLAASMPSRAGDSPEDDKTAADSQMGEKTGAGKTETPSVDAAGRDLAKDAQQAGAPKKGTLTIKGVPPPNGDGPSAKEQGIGRILGGLALAVPAMGVFGASIALGGLAPLIALGALMVGAGVLVGAVTYADNKGQPDRRKKAILEGIGVFATGIFALGAYTLVGMDKLGPKIAGWIHKLRG